MGLRLMDPLDWFSVDRDYDVTLDLRDQLYREHPDLCLVDTGPGVRCPPRSSPCSFRSARSYVQDLLRLAGPHLRCNKALPAQLKTLWRR